MCLTTGAGRFGIDVGLLAQGNAECIVSRFVKTQGIERKHLVKTPV